MIKSQYEQMIKKINDDKYAITYIEVICTDASEQSLNRQDRAEVTAFAAQEPSIVLNSLLALLGLITLKVTFSYHGDDYQKINYYFVSRDELVDILELQQTLQRF